MQAAALSPQPWGARKCCPEFFLRKARYLLVAWFSLGLTFGGLLGRRAPTLKSQGANTVSSHTVLIQFRGMDISGGLREGGGLH